VKRILQWYANMRVGATAMEKRAYHAGDSVMLTFDDYGSPEQVEQLLEILSKSDVRAMFFLQGDWAQQHPELLKQIVEAGHVIGNHTYSHRDLLSLDDADVRKEIAGGPGSTWLRPPRGRYDKRIRRIAAELGYKICYWSIDSDDWQGGSAEQIDRNVLGQLHPGAVILFHIHGPHTLEALPGVIAGIRERGYTVWS
jgi:peptidoglycan-N-acetylglucosamine deacetylase